MDQAMEERRETSLRDFLAVLFRRKWLVIGVVLAAVAIVVLLDRATPPMYESTAQVLVSRGQPESAYSSRVKLLTWEEDLNSELETAKSSHVLQLAQKILDDGGVKDSDGAVIKIDPAQISTTTPGKSSVIYIRARSQDPLVAQEVVRAVTQAYANFRRSVRTVPELETFFRDEIDGTREQLEDWEERRADFMNRESVSRIPDERFSQIQVRQQLEVDLNRVRSDLAAEQARVEVLQGLLSTGATSEDNEVYVFSSSDNSDDQVVFQIRKSLVDRRAAYLAARAQYTDEHPAVVALKEEVDQLETMLHQETENYLRHLQAKVDVLKAQEESLLSSLAYADGELSSYPSKEARLASFDRIIQALQADYEALVDKQIQARLERIGSPDWNILILQPANKALPLRLNDLVRMAVIPAIGLILAIGLAFLVDGMDHSVKDATEAERHLGLPVLGSVGRLR